MGLRLYSFFFLLAKFDFNGIFVFKFTYFFSANTIANGNCWDVLVEKLVTVLLSGIKCGQHFTYLARIGVQILQVLPFSFP